MYNLLVPSRLLDGALPSDYEYDEEDDFPELQEMAAEVEGAKRLYFHLPSNPFGPTEIFTISFSKKELAETVREGKRRGKVGMLEYYHLEAETRINFMVYSAE